MFRSIHSYMLRIARLDTPGLLHHVMIRGIERRQIFNDDKDRENLIERLSTLLPEINDHAKQSACVSGINFPSRCKKFLRS